VGTTMHQLSKTLQAIIENKQAIFFDMDGTIINSEPIHAKTIIKILNDLKIDLHDLLTREDELIGKTDLDVYNELVRARPNTTQIISSIEFLAIKNRAIIDILSNTSDSQINSLLTPGVLAFIRYLRQHQIDCKLALISASEPEIVKAMLAKIGILDSFDLIASNIDTACSKPSPSPYLAALRFFRLASNKVVTFEDSPTGIAASLAAGIPTVRISAFTQHRIFEVLPTILNFL